ncbi:MAG TPA: hypothetical protein PLZ78_15910 [Spirochaetota bacterium]|nr:hypothetical protein [Spirochaetota bacterium]
MGRKKSLQPCEACGSEDAYIVPLPKAPGGVKFYVRCARCERRTMRCDSREEARALWNGEEYCVDPMALERRKVEFHPPAVVEPARDNPMGPMGEMIPAFLDQVEHFLLEKIRRYGNSALVPLNIFSRAPAAELVRARIDDKIARIRNGSELRKNDVVDLIGYLVLLSIQQGWEDLGDLVD